MLANWKLMSLSREFDLYVKEFAKKDESVGYLHTSIGQEASSVGIIQQFRSDDWMTSTYRNHSHGVARGLDIYKMVAELLGRRTGYCKGLGDPCTLPIKKQILSVRWELLLVGSQ